MSRMALIALVMTLVVNPARAGLCELTQRSPRAGRPVDFLSSWQADCVNQFLAAGREHLTPFWGSSRAWDVGPWPGPVGGDDPDRRWYAYLDRGRYQFLDETQYTLLDGPAGLWWRWRYHAWLDAVNLSWSVPARSGGGTSEVVPEPGTAVFLALGAFAAAATHRNRPRQRR